MLSYHSAHALSAKIKYGVEAAVVAPIIFLGLVVFVWNADPGAIRATFTALAATSPLWLPFFLLKYFWVYWIHYIRYKYWFKQEMILLEVQLPAEVAKSPRAMELIFTAMFNTGGENTFIKRIWDGSFRPTWSIEIASDEGRVNYYIHMRKSFRSTVESRIYGQYPEAQVREVEDYTRQVHFNLEEYDLWGAEFRKAAAQALPIKTYVDYGLDKDPDEELKIDPLTNVLELMAQIGKGEHLWLQMIIMGRGKDQWYGFIQKTDAYKDSYKTALATIMKGAADRAGGLVSDPQAKAQAAARGLTLLTPGERLKVEAMERQIEKTLFECGIRILYIAKKANFRGGTVPSVAGVFNPFRSSEFNMIVPTRWLASLDYPWQDFMNIRRNMMKRKLFFLYQNRAYFFVPMDQVPVFLTVEELATLWHFPSSIVRTPGLNRVASKRAEAPPELPQLPV